MARLPAGMEILDGPPPFDFEAWWASLDSDEKTKVGLTYLSRKYASGPRKVRFWYRVVGREQQIAIAPKQPGNDWTEFEPKVET